MKNCKSILLILVGITAINNFHITQTDNDSSWDKFWNACTDLLRTESAYENYLNQFRNDLRGIPQKDIDSIISIARRKLTTTKPENNYHINQLMREAIIDQVRTITITMAEHYTHNQEEIDASIRSMVGNTKARLGQGDNLNGQALAQFFDRDSLKKLVLQNVKTSIKPAICPQPVYPTKQPTYPQPATQVKPSKPIAYHASYDDYLNQLKSDLRGIPKSDISAIVAIGQQELLRKKPTNDHKKNDIIREAIINRVRTNTRSIASKLTNDQTAVDNTVQSMSGNVKARLARGDNLNGQALEQFFGSNHERMVKQNISGSPSTKKIYCPKPVPEKLAPSAPKEPTQEDADECFICCENTGKNIPCKNSHPDKICSSCIPILTICPICREVLIK